jgi:hypothetical protein
MSTIVHHVIPGCYGSARLALVAPAASWAVADHERACGPCPSYGKRRVRVSHSSLDGAESAPPTTAHKALLGFTEEEQMRKMTRLTKGGSRG